MRMPRPGAYGFLLVFIWVAGCAPIPSSGDSPADWLPARLVPEMERIEEVDRCEYLAPDSYARATEQVRREWPSQWPRLAEQITRPVVQGLSRWAKSEMQSYPGVPARAQANPRVIGLDKGRMVLVYEVILDTLPTHNPLVTRWLKVFILYDLHRGRALQAVVTIRGQVLE